MRTKRKRTIYAADLFCGAGGTSQGLLMAANRINSDLELLAINHWQVAIDTHALNHPEAQNLCTGVDVVDPLKLVPSGRLDIMCASPECTHHSVARGGKPMNDQSRASAWHILRWAQVLYIDNLIIENVPEFQSWGPLGANGRPMESKKGELFKQFILSLKALGYTVEYRVLNCADYGAPTTRRRLFLIARRGNKKIAWPEATHVQPSEKPTLFADSRNPWRTAREIIDWKRPSKDIFDRKKPLAPNTLRRIAAGMLRFNGIKIDLEKCVREGLRPYLVVLRGTGTTASVDDPLQTVTANGNHYGLVQPFLLPHRVKDGVHDVAEPFRTITATSSDFALVEPFIVPNFGEREGQKPRTHSVDEPTPAVTGHGAGALVEPFMVTVNHGEGDMTRRTKSLDDPMSTVTGSIGEAICEPFLATVIHQGGDRVRPIDQPMATVTRSMGDGVCEPFLSAYYGTDNLSGVNAPVPTVVTKDRFGLSLPQWIREGDLIYRLEIRFRMLQPRELARAQGFDDDYRFTGNREEVVKQIGNAVPPPIAAALVGAVLA